MCDKDIKMDDKKGGGVLKVRTLQDMSVDGLLHEELKLRFDLQRQKVDGSFSHLQFVVL